MANLYSPNPIMVLAVKKSECVIAFETDITVNINYPAYVAVSVHPPSSKLLLPTEGHGDAEK